jgi:Icc-related predicted phosphoesterase
MKIVCLSDTHTLHNKISIPDGDVLIHAGDLTGRGSFEDYFEAAYWLEKLRHQFKYRIIIAGNHDFNMDKMLGHFDQDVIYLQDNEVTIDGVIFYGSPWTPPFYDWAFMKNEDQLARQWDLIPEDCDVLITHGPPYSILDKNGEGERCGSVTLYDRIKELKLRHHIFGHIHESYGSEEIAGTTFHNVCSLNGQYRITNKPVVIEL